MTKKIKRMVTDDHSFCILSDIEIKNKKLYLSVVISSLFPYDKSIYD